MAFSDSSVREPRQRQPIESLTGRLTWHDAGFTSHPNKSLNWLRNERAVKAERRDVRAASGFSEASMDHLIAREERLQLLRFLVALILFICALHVLCSRDNQMALAHAERLRVEPASAAGPQLAKAEARPASLLSGQPQANELSH